MVLQELPPSPSFLRQGFFTGTWDSQAKLVLLAREPQGSAYSPTSDAGITMHATSPGFLHGCWGPNLGPMLVSSQFNK